MIQGDAIDDFGLQRRVDVHDPDRCQHDLYSVISYFAKICIEQLQDPGNPENLVHPV